MLNSRAQLIGAWVAGVITLMACSVIADVELTIRASELWLVASVVPPAVMLLAGRGAPPATVAQLLYSTSGRSEEGRP